MDPFLTVYKKEYVQKFAKRPAWVGTSSEFENPVTEGFKNYLKLSSITEAFKPPKEDADVYLKKYQEKYPQVAKTYFQTPINSEIVTKNLVYNGRTVYQADYGNIEKEEEYKEEQRRRDMYRLPDDWNIPLTTQNYFFRNPLIINSRALEPVKQIRVPNNLDPAEHIRKILKVKTGKSEYGGVIGDLGGLIIDENLHGQIIHPKCSCPTHSPQNKN